MIHKYNHDVIALIIVNPRYKELYGIKELIEFSFVSYRDWKDYEEERQNKQI